MLWGNLLGVDVTWKDGEFDPQKQREKIDLDRGRRLGFLLLSGGADR